MAPGTAPGRQSRRCRPLPRCPCAVPLGILVASALAGVLPVLGGLCDAFAQGPTFGRASRPWVIGSWQQPAAPNHSGRHAHRQHTQSKGSASTGGGVWRLAGCGALLASAARVRRRGGPAKPSRPRAAPCASKPVCVNLVTESQPDTSRLAAVQPCPSTGTSAWALTGMTAKSTLKPMLDVQLPGLGGSEIGTPCAPDTTIAGLSLDRLAAGGLPRALRAGRRVGRARRTCRRGYGSVGVAGAARSARRRTGVRLGQQPRRVGTVPPPAYEPSRVRARIQLGLRVTSRTSSARGRESRTPASTESLESTGMCMRGNQCIETLHRTTLASTLC